MFGNRDARTDVGKYSARRPQASASRRLPSQVEADLGRVGSRLPPGSGSCMTRPNSCGGQRYIGHASFIWSTWRSHGRQQRRSSVENTRRLDTPDPCFRRQSRVFHSVHQDSAFPRFYMNSWDRFRSKLNPFGFRNLVFCRSLLHSYVAEPQLRQTGTSKFAVFAKNLLLNAECVQPVPGRHNNVLHAVEHKRNRRITHITIKACMP